jgi:formate dehydrogenase subunit delta
MSSSSADKLVYMANQIGSFFATQRSEDPKAGISNHILKFWEPRMREQIFSYIDHGGQGLNDLVRDAILDLKSKQKA